MRGYREPQQPASTMAHHQKRKQAPDEQISGKREQAQDRKHRAA
jgi:hypothetical protein